MVCKLAEIMREKLNRAKALKFRYHLIVLEENAGRNKHKVKMKTPGAEEFAEWREHQVQIRVNEKEYPHVDTSLMKFQKLGLRENPKSHREKMVTFVGKQMKRSTSRLKERETPFVAICRIIGTR